MPELDTKNGSLHGVKARVTAFRIMVILDLGAPAVPPPDILGNLVVVGGNTSTIAPGPKVLARIGRSCGGMTKGANKLAFVLSTLCLSTVLDNIEVVLLGNGQDSIHICWMAIQVNREDCLGSDCDLSFNLIAIDCLEVRLNIA